MGKRHTDTTVFPQLQRQGVLSSKTLQNVAANGSFVESLQQYGDSAHREAEEIFNLAQELKGDPDNSTAYIQAVELHRQLLGLYKLVKNHHTFFRSASLVAKEA